MAFAMHLLDANSARLGPACMPLSSLIFPSGNVWRVCRLGSPKYSRAVRLSRMARLNSKDIGKAIRQARRNLGVTQKAVALTSGTGESPMGSGRTFGVLNLNWPE